MTRPELCPNRDLALREAEGSAEFYGLGSPEGDRAAALYDQCRARSERSGSVPVEYHLSEDPDDADLGQAPAARPKLLPGKWWQWLIFFELALVGWIAWYLRGIF